MSIAQRAEHMAKLMSRYSQQPFYNQYRDAYLESDHFSSFDADDDYVVTQATAGTADVIDGAGGILQLDSNSATADQGIQVQHKTETFLPAADKHIIFECRCKVTDTIAGVQFFAGLSILDTTMFVSGENSSTDHVGFEANATTQAATSGRLDLVHEDGGTRTSQSTVHTLAEDTYVVLGFFVDGISRIVPLINGVAGTAVTPSATWTPTEMAATFVCQEEGGSVDPIMSLDWYYCIQIN
jgi:hypothetical protein